MVKIRHVAFMVHEPKALRDFYQQGFGFEQCYESASGAIMVMDGLFNLALLKIREGDSDVVGTHRADGGEADQRPGINHFGFVVDSVEETLGRIGSDLKQGENPQDGRPAEMRVFDPWSNGFDLSARGFFGREEKRLPAVRQVVLQADRPAEVAGFYTAKLDLTEEGRAPDGSVLLGDGYIHLAVVQEGVLPKRGIQYIGIQVDDWDAQAERFKAIGRALPSPREPGGEVMVRDPEGNLVALSTTGWDR
jgi:catechol 2,3-dioxygenase-like lactoylglutathione lyase family enzyme